MKNVWTVFSKFHLYPSIHLLKAQLQHPRNRIPRFSTTTYCVATLAPFCSCFKNNIVTGSPTRNFLLPSLSLSLSLSLKKRRKKRKKNGKNSEAATNTWYLATKPVYTRKGEGDGWAGKTSGDKSNNRWISVRGADGESRRFLWHKSVACNPVKRKCWRSAVSC